MYLVYIAVPILQECTNNLVFRLFYIIKLIDLHFSCNLSLYLGVAVKMASLLLLGSNESVCKKVASYILDYPKLVDSCKAGGTCSDFVNIVRKFDR